MSGPRLNPPQAEAVTHGDGPLLVFAGAGSGKTRVITYRIADLVATRGVPPWRVLAVTFTNKAAGELRARLAALLGEDVTRDLHVGTFHAISARLLRRYHAEVGLTQRFTIYDDSDQKAVMGRVLQALGHDERALPPRQALHRIHALKQQGVGPDEARTRTDQSLEDVRIYAAYQAALRQADAVDFDDLLVMMMQLAESEGPAGEELRGRYHHVLVDEFQDTNPVQYRLVRALTRHTHNLCVVGDDDQSIYGWRGADVRLILGFLREHPEARVVKLEENYRSTGNIVSAALGVIGRAARREPKQLFTRASAGAPVVVQQLPDERAEAAWVVARVQAERAGDARPDRVAVFYRIHAMSRVLEEAFRAANVPYRIIGGLRFFDRAEVKDCIAYLRLVENPRSDADFLRVINVPPRGIGDKTVQHVLDEAARRNTSAFDALDALLASGGMSASLRKKLAPFAELIHALRAEASELGPAALARHALQRSGYSKWLDEQDSAEADARRENLEELVGSLAEYEAEEESAERTPTLGGWLERVALASNQDTPEGEVAVPLMTVHAAKGLEFDAVVLVGLEDEVFPYAGPEGGDDRDLDEERRLAYVAVTRARQRLFITHVGTRTLFGRTRYSLPSPFLSDIPREVIERRGGNPSGRSDASRVAGGYGRGGAAWGGNPGWRGAGGHGAGGRATPGWSSAERAGAERPRAGAEHGGAAHPAPGERIVEYDDVGTSPGGAELACGDVGSGEEGVAFRPGLRVRHPRYGVGRVESVRPGVDPSVEVTFPAWGTKRLLARFLQPA